MRSDGGEGTGPRRGRDGLGLFKSVVEFFTSVAGLAAAGVGLLGAVAAFALADVKPGGQESPPDPSPPVVNNVRQTGGQTTPAPTPTAAPGVDPDTWVRDVNNACLTAVGLGAFAQDGDLSVAVDAFSTLAAALRASPAPSGFEDTVATAADELDQAAAAARVGDPSAIDHANTASAALNSLGAVDC